MKISSLVVFYVMGTAVTILAQTSVQNPTPASGMASIPAPTPYQISDVGANYRVWQWQTFELLGNGQVIPHNHSYTELASGLNYVDSTTGRWVPAQELIEPYIQGAIAQRGQTRVIFANNLNTSGAIDEETPEGKRLVSNILGLMYVDTASGQSAQIAEIQDSEGQLIAANQILYTNAFNGVKASARFTYRRDGIEQDVILDAQPPAPEAFGMKSQTAQLVVVTEFLNPPEAQVWNVGTDHSDLEPDQTVNWGATSLGHGRAFSLHGQDVPITVIKQYVQINGRYFLFEKVRYQEIQPALSLLPTQASSVRHLRTMASTDIHFPRSPSAKVRSKPIRMALSQNLDRGYVLDYTSLNSTYTNYLFQGDTTYYISGTVNLAGTNNIFEGGTVIKYATNVQIAAVSGSQFNFASQPFHPVVFTAKDDNTVGETISGSTGNPIGYYASDALSTTYSPTSQWSNVRISYASIGISPYSSPLTLNDVQFANCGTAVSAFYGNVAVNNGLFYKVQTDFFGLGASVTAANASFVNNTNAATALSGTTVCLTNCILVNVTNVTGATGSYNGFYQTPVFGANNTTNTFFPLQSSGSGNCYLTNGCAFFQAGTASVGSNVLVLLTNRTTWPPVIFSNLTFSTSTNFGPQAGRDTNSSPDLGYHYYPLDYAFGGVQVYSNLTFSAGTTVGWFQLPGSGGTGYGVTIYDKVVLAFAGTASAPCVMTKSETVQEGGNGLWVDKGYMAGVVTASLSGGYGMSPTNAAMTMADFTHFFVMASDPNLFRESSALSQVYAQNSEFYSGGIGAYWDNLSATNCLFDRVGAGVGGSNPAQYWMRNCTMHGGSLTLNGGTSITTWIEECAFDGTSLTIYTNSLGNTNLLYLDFNAFLTNAATLSAPGTYNVIVTNFNWQSSWFGNYYLPPNSPLTNAGSTTADKFGLYHFTTQTNQVPETNSIVDTGYHYVDTDQYGNPLDSNGNGVPDYIEDACGCGQSLTVTLLSPTNNTFYAEPATIPLQVLVLDWRSVVTNVFFLNSSLQILATTNTPFQGSWPVVAAGAYSVSATASDLAGAAANSASASITVTNLCSP